MRNNFSPSLLGVCCLAVLAGCSGHPATGTFIGSSGDKAVLVDLTESDHGQLVGRVEHAEVKPDGGFADDGTAVSGQRDHDHLALALSVPLVGPVPITGLLNGNSLGLEGPSLSIKLHRGDPKDFDKAVAVLRTRAAGIVAQRAKAEADAQVQRRLAQIQAAVALDQANLSQTANDLSTKAEGLQTRLEGDESKFAAERKAYADLSGQVDQALAKAQSGPKNFARLNQLANNINGALVQIENRHGQLEGAEQSLAGVIRDQLSADKAAVDRCGAMGLGATTVAEPCKKLASRDQAIRAVLPQLQTWAKDADARYAEARGRLEVAERQATALADQALRDSNGG